MADTATTPDTATPGDATPSTAADSDRFAAEHGLNIFSDRYVQDSAQGWDEVRGQCPVAHTTEYGVGWVPITWDAIAEVAYDTDAFSSRDISVAPSPEDASLLVAPPITSDPPMHTDARRLLLPFFAPKAVEPMAETTREISRDRLDAIEVELAELKAAAASDKPSGVPAADPAADNVIDAAESYAKHIPVRVIARMLGLPESDEMQFSGWAIDILQTDVEEVERRIGATKALLGYFAELVEMRRRERADDLPSKLIDMTLPNGDALTDQHIVGTCFLLLIAGIDTTQSSIGAALNYLATHSEDRQRLVDEPELIPTAIEEILRAFSPVTMARVVAEDTEIAGCPVHAGEKVYLAFGAGNRDPEKFDRADEVVIDRTENRHFAFGLGIHRCLGSNLARLELKIALEEWLKRFPDFELATECEGGGVIWRGVQVRGPRHLYLRINA